MTQTNRPAVHIYETFSAGREWTYRPMIKTLTALAAKAKANGTSLRDELEGHALARLFGQHAFFHQDNGLPRGYGQIFRTMPGSGWCASSVTGRVYLEVLNAENFTPVPEFIDFGIRLPEDIRRSGVEKCAPRGRGISLAVANGRVLIEGAAGTPFYLCKLRNGGYMLRYRQGRGDRRVVVDCARFSSKDAFWKHAAEVIDAVCTQPVVC